MRTHYVMDFETLSNCFVAVFEDYKKDDTKVFVISNLRNDIVPLLKFLKDNLKYDQWHISYNGLNFDSQITQYILINAKRLAYMQGGEIAA